MFSNKPIKLQWTWNTFRWIRKKSSSFYAQALTTVFLTLQRDLCSRLSFVFVFSFFVTCQHLLTIQQQARMTCISRCTHRFLFQGQLWQYHYTCSQYGHVWHSHHHSYWPVQGNLGLCFVCWLLNVPATCECDLRDGSAQTILHAATLRYKLQTKLSIQSQYTDTRLTSPSTDPINARHLAG